MITRVAVIQMVSTTDVVENIELMSTLLQEAKDKGANWVVLPEYWPLMGSKDTDKLKIREIFGKGGRLQKVLSEKARDLQFTIFAGSIPLECGDASKIYNSLLVFDKHGKVISRYNKKHLFGYIGLGESFREEDTILEGESPQILEIDSFKIAQGICFDLRFPEFFREQLPFDVLVLPAAFTYTTGQAHWEVLLRARAIENQCYVLASAQGGKHQSGRQTFGHSMVINPWGEVVVKIESGSGVITADLSLSLIRSIRKKLPVFNEKTP